MPDIAVTPVQRPRPFWLPDTQGFLAIAIILLMGTIVLILLNSDTQFDDKTAGVLMTVLGVLTACLKDVYSFFFGSSKGSDKKDDVISAIAAAPPAAPAPAAPPTPDQLGDSMLSNGELAYFKSLTDEEAKKKFLAMSQAERTAAIGKV